MKLRGRQQHNDTLNPDFFSTQVTQARRFYLNLNPSPRARLLVVSGGVEQCAPDYTVRRKSFPFYSIEFVPHGRGRLRIRNRDHELLPGSVFSYGPEVSHEIQTSPQEPLTKYFVDFSGIDAPKLLKHCRLRSGSISQVFPPTEILPVFDELIRNGLRTSGNVSDICVSLLQTLSLKIADARAPLSGPDIIAFGTYQRCRDHISRHFLRLRTVRQIAAECHLDEAYLCRLFKRYNDETPYRFLLRLKMNYAAEQLQMPGTLVKQVAENTGFTNPFHFSRAFKSVFGVSPRALIMMR